MRVFKEEFWPIKESTIKAKFSKVIEYEIGFEGVCHWSHRWSGIGFALKVLWKAIWGYQACVIIKEVN